MLSWLSFLVCTASSALPSRIPPLLHRVLDLTLCILEAYRPSPERPFIATITARTLPVRHAPSLPRQNQKPSLLLGTVENDGGGT